MDVTSAFLDVNNTRLHYQSAGRGRPVVLLHGFSLDLRMWEAQFETLAHHFRLIRYDLRGFGKSAVPAGQPYSHVDDLHALLAALDISQASLVGLSKGAAVAIDYRLTHPAQVRSLCLLDPVLGGFNWSAAGSARDAAVWQRAAEGGIPAAKESWLAHPIFAPARRNPAAAALLEQIIAEYSGWHFVNPNPEQGLALPAARRLDELTLPVLLMVGEADTPDFRQIGELLAAELPDVRTVIVPGAGHMVNLEAAPVVNFELLQFLAKHA